MQIRLHQWLALGLCALLAGSVVPGQTRADEAPRIRFATWQNNAKAAISLSFDDWTPDHWSRGMELWKEYGFRVTLGVTMAKLDKRPEMVEHLQNAFNAGHELANHSMHHENFQSMTQGQIRFDLGECNDFILSHVQGLKYINTVIYPEEYFDDATLKTVEEMGYLFARSGPQGVNDIVMLNEAIKPPFLHLFSWCNQNNLSVQQWNDAAEWAASHSGWLIEECHGIGKVGEEGVGWSPRPEEEYRAHFDYLKNLGDRIWVAPVGDVGKYIMERNACKGVVTAFGPDALTFEIQGDLDFDRFDIPLTVEIQRPALWIRVSATQNGASLPCNYGDNGWVRFNALPGGGPVTVSKAATAGREGL